MRALSVSPLHTHTPRRQRLSPPCPFLSLPLIPPHPLPRPTSYQVHAETAGETNRAEATRGRRATSNPAQ